MGIGASNLKSHKGNKKNECSMFAMFLEREQRDKGEFSNLCKQKSVIEEAIRENQGGVLCGSFVGGVVGGSGGGGGRGGGGGGGGMFGKGCS